MANLLRVPNTIQRRTITWVQRGNSASGECLCFTLRDENNKPIAKAKLTAEQLHQYICMHNTMK